MSFLRAARAALAASSRAYCMQIVVTFILAGLSVSCGSSHSSSASHNAYVTLPTKGSVALLHVNDSTGAIALSAQTAAVLNSSPTGIALDPSKKFLYVGNSAAAAHSLSTFSVNGDGSLTLTGEALDVGDSPRALTVDASGKYLLITTSFADTSQNGQIFSLDSATGALTKLGNFQANTSPNNIIVSPTSNFVYIANADVGLITAYSLDSATGALTPIAGSPFTARAGVAGMAVDPGGRYLYAANHSNDTISAYRIDSGVLTPLVDSPFLLGVGTGPQAIAIDTTGTFLYVANSGSNNVSGFMIMADTGVLSPINSGTPFGAGTTPVFILAEPAGKYLYVGNQGSTNITGFSYDATTGKLTAISGSPFTVPSAPGMMTIAH